MRIECGIINYKLIIPFMYPIFFQIRRKIHENEEKPMLEFFTNYLGYLFSGLIYLIIKYRMKKKKVILDKDINENEIEEIVVELNDVLLPNEDENTIISKGSFKKVKSLKKKKNTDNNQNELEKEKIKKYKKRN